MIIAASVGFTVLIIAFVLILKKFVFDGRRDKDSDKTQTNTTEQETIKDTNSEGNAKTTMTEDDMSPQSINDYQQRVSKVSIASNSSRSSIPSSRNMNFKYFDILPPTRPPPIGLLPTLSAEQQLNRPLPPTPPPQQ